MTSPPSRRDGERTWTIAEMAQEFGITHRTLRHYESIGLITPLRRGTQRVFRRRDRTRLRLILRGKRLGFTLEEARRIVDMYDDLPGEAGQLRYLISQINDRRDDLERRRRDIEDSLRELDELERRCHEDLRAFHGAVDAARPGLLRPNSGEDDPPRARVGP